jgi:5-methylcytosine-specific restriction endonuclease McrA
MPHTITSHEEEQPITCVGCGETKPATQFALLKTTRNGEIYYRRRPKCNACIVKRRFEMHPPKYITNPKPNDPQQFRTCKTCGETKPIVEFPLAKSKRNGKERVCRRGECAGCTRKRQNEWRREKTFSGDERPDMKICCTCKMEKPSGEFGVSTREKDGLCDKCKACRKAYYERNKEAISRKSAAWQRKNIDRHKERMRRYILRHPERYKVANKIHAENRRTRKSKAGGSFTVKEWRELCDRYGNCCLACGKQVSLTADHIVPVSKGGTSSIDNIQPLCQSCNSKKGRQIIDYRAIKGGWG